MGARRLLRGRASLTSEAVNVEVGLRGIELLPHAGVELVVGHGAPEGWLAVRHVRHGQGGGQGGQFWGGECVRHGQGGGQGGQFWGGEWLAG